MRFERRETFALGELALFCVAWLCALVAALGDYQGRINSAARDNVAASDNVSEIRNTLD